MFRTGACLEEASNNLHVSVLKELSPSTIRVNYQCGPECASRESQRTDPNGTLGGYGSIFGKELLEEEALPACLEQRRT